MHTPLGHAEPTRGSSVLEAQENTDEPLVVLHAIKAPGNDTTYASQMRDSATAGTDIRFFSWRDAFHSSYDVIHLHWPEYLVRGKGKKDALLSFVRIPRLIRKIRRDRVAVVRTLHNLTPHENGYSFEGLLLRALDRQVTRYIALNAATDSDREATEVILHGDYVDRFSTHPRPPVADGRILYFGLVRPYKGIDRLIDVFGQLDVPGLTLRIVGRPNSAEMSDAITQEITRSPGTISGRLEFVSDAELVAEVSGAELIVLPYREMHNSGSLLVALSLGKPVLTPNTPVNRALAEEIGEGWLWLYDGELTPTIVTSTFAAVRSGSRPDRPVFAGRDWDTVGRKHEQLYRTAVRSRRGA